MAYCVVRTDKMLGTDAAAAVVSVKYYAENAVAEIENGNVVAIAPGNYAGRDVYKAVAPTATSDLKDVVVVASPEIMYDVKEYELEKFINAAGDVARAYRLHAGDVFSVTADGLDGLADIAGAEVGKSVYLQDSTKMIAKASEDASSTKVGTIIDVETVGRFKFYAIQVA